MKNRSVLLSTLLVLALFLAACGAQDTTSEPGDVTAMPTTSSDGLATVDATGEADMTPTGTMGEATPAQGTAETSTAPTTSPDGSTATQSVGGTAVIPQTGGDAGEAGVPDDLDEVLRILRETGVTVDLGDSFDLEAVSVPGQTVRINGEDVQIFSYTSAENLESEASQLQKLNPPMDEPHFYKMGTMLVRYVGNDPLVRDLIEDVLGANRVGQ